ncbi:dihydroxyacetone kinase subunit L [Emergencia timonensis]|uniref:dihydroxyacetone kinase subunit L n=1 Tax=Emergencia timonensis TaxID=1776384 RepID=UPI0039969926
MSIDKQVLSEMLSSAAESFIAHSDALSEIDSKFGDGDHGITVKKIGNLIEEKVESWETETFGEFFEDLGMAIMGVNGGSAGPLYGTLIGGLGVDLTDEIEIDAELLKEMFASCLSEMEDITTAKVGDKTMMDALIPAVEAAQEAEDSIPAILRAAAEAARRGAKESEKFVSKFGRAKSYKEQTIGTPDAGAMSTALFFEGFAKPVM